MTNEQIEIERKEFEKWLMAEDAGRGTSDGVFERNGDGSGYLYDSVQAAWKGWLARAAR